jgi:HlyD family secretion protein
MNVKALVAGLAIVIVGVGAWWLLSGSAKTGKAIWVKPKKGKFEVAVTVQGELQAKNSIDIEGPSRSRKVGINQMKIARLVDEGTVVKKGDFIAELDRAEIVTKLKEIEINLQKFESQHTQAPSPSLRHAMKL